MSQVETESRARPYCYPTQNDQAIGKLRLGWRDYPVLVCGYSWAGYTIEVNNSLARKLSLGREAKLTHQGSTYEVSCLSRVVVRKNLVQIELQREDNHAERNKLIRRNKTAARATISLNQRDPVLSFATWVFIIMMLMILPGWGESLGTTQYFTEGFKSVFMNVCDAAKCLCGG
jgi:hypothetical protein